MVWVKMRVNCLTHTVTHTAKCPKSVGEDMLGILSDALYLFT